MVEPVTSPSRVPRLRGRPPSLTRDQIVDAALRLTREIGLTNLSMRALARDLDVPTMTIYSYVPNKEVLHGLVVDHILSEIPIPGPDDGNWEERLRAVLGDARQVFADHPGVLSRLGEGGSTETLRLADGVLSILRDGGFTSSAAVLCFATLYTFMTGQIDLDAMAEAVASRSPHATLDGVTRIAHFSRDEIFEFGFNAVIEGLKLTLNDP